MAKVRVGIIGCGKIAQVHHVPALLAMPGKATIAALYDVSEKTAKALQAMHTLDAPICTRLKQLLALELDAVVISTPNSTHCPLTCKALEAGLHVLVEKPMAASLAEADRMIALAKKKRKVLAVNQTLRFTPPYVMIKKLIDRGRIGELIHLRCLRSMGRSPDKSWSPGADWFVQKKFRGGLIMDIAVHMADIMELYAGPAEKLYANTQIREKGHEVPDNVTSLIEYRNGATGVLELSWTTPVGGGYLELYGTKGTIRMGFDGGKLELAKPGKGFEEVKPTKTKNAHQCFVDDIQGKAKTPVDGPAGRSALALCLAIEKSGKTGRPVTLK
ncbi:MAG: Gfo/Idh/MocA family protein [Planctomycetota bacterium]|jgi:predicted dehydrogenase